MSRFYMALIFLSAILWQPVHAAVCSAPGRQDATCISPILYSGPVKPTCPAGQQVITPSSWTGSSWTLPSCKPVTPPPPGNAVCPYGFASGPTWNGSSWTYVCNPPPGPTLSYIGTLNTITADNRGAWGQATSVFGRAAVGNCYSLSGTIPTLTMAFSRVTFSNSATVMCYIPAYVSYTFYVSRYQRLTLKYYPGWYIGTTSPYSPYYFYLMPISSPSAAYGSLYGTVQYFGSYACNSSPSDHLCL